MVQVFTLHLSDLLGKETLLFDLADRKRREKALRFVQIDDRIRCLAAGYLMKKCIPGFSEERLFTGKDGKPFLHSGPAFSVSHGGNAIVLSWDEHAEGIGIDVEPIGNMNMYRAILSLYATEKEQKEIDGDARMAVWVWTRKESLYKSIGEGYNDFLELPEVLEDELQWQGMLTRLSSWEDDRHVFSVAVRNPDTQFHIQQHLMEIP